MTLKTEDGWTIKGDYQPPERGKIVVLLIHSLQGTRREWADLIGHLRALGLGTLAMDLRGYGASTQGPYGAATYRDFTDADWPKTIKDVQASVAYLHDQGIEEDRIALVGSMVGANIISMASTAYPDAAWMILLSPSNDYHGLSAGLGGEMDTLLAAGQDDLSSLVVCRSLADNDPAKTLFIAPLGGKGLDLFKDSAFLKQILDWVKNK